jgi:triphosphatase
MPMTQSTSPPPPVKSKPSPISAEMNVAQAFRAIAGDCLHQVRANEPCLRGDGNPEAIHQMRVGLRRLRSALRVFRAAIDGAQFTQVRDDLRWLLARLGPARDDHVFLDEIIGPVVASQPATAPFRDLQDAFQAQHDHNVRVALDAVADDRFSTIIMSVAAWIEAGDWTMSQRPVLTEAIFPFARAALAKRDHRLRRAAGDDLGALSPVDLHRTRILAKQLRYTAEFFAPLWPNRESHAFAAKLGLLQDRLGELNDISVGTRRLAADGSWAAGLITGWHANRRPLLLNQAKKAWKKYRKHERFWRKG